MALQGLIPILCVLLVSLPLKISFAHHHHHHRRKHPSNSSLFIFGDSILDVGNNNYINTTTLDQANFWPYGITFFHFPTGRFSDGRLISDFIAERANLALIPPFLQPGRPRFYDGVNFASAGAGALVGTFQGSVIDLHMQLRNYKNVEKWLRYKLGNVKARRVLTKAVNMLSIGTNDYMSLFLTNSTLLTTYSKSQYVDMVIGNITSVINEIYKNGGRKFAFLNLPPVGCFPALRILDASASGNCLKEVSTYVMLHNKALYQLLKQLAKQLPGFKYFLYDFYTSIVQRINHPSQYGYREAKTACCGTGEFRGVFSCGGKRPVKQFEMCKNIEDHIFWDSYHMTEKVYGQIAEEMWSNTNYVLHSYGSYTIKDLFFLP